MLAECVDGCRGHGIDGVGSDQLLDVHHVAVLRIFGASARPQRSLHSRSLLRQCFPPGPREFLAEKAIRQLRVGDGGATLQHFEPVLFRAISFCDQGVEAFIDLGIDAADEEAGHRSQTIDRPTGFDAIFETGHVRLDDALVCLNGEKQRDVDVDTFRDKSPHGYGAFGRTGDFDHHVGPVHCLPEASCLFDRRVGGV